MNTSMVSLGAGPNDCGCGGPSCAGRGFTIDTPMQRGSSGSTYVSKALGHVMGVKGLSDLQPGGGAGPVISRASNVANLTLAMVLQVRPEAREALLTRIGGFNWANDVLRAAHYGKESTNPTESLRASLALHFLVGMLEAENQKDSPNARAYLAFVRVFKDSQDRRHRPAGAVEQLGLGGLSAAQPAADETAMDDDHKWCEENKDKSFPASELAKCKRCPHPAGAFNSAHNEYNYAEWYGAYLCKRPAPWEEQGRRDRGMSYNWVPPVTFPAPPDKSSVDTSKFKELCGTGNPSDRVQGVRELFNRVFSRYPNNTEIEYYGSMKYCVNRAGGDAPSMRLEMEKVRTAIVNKQAANTTPGIESGLVDASAFGERKNVVQAAADAAFDFAGKTTAFIINSVCAAFKQVMGPLVGQAICDIFTVIINSYASLALALVTIVQEGFQGIIDSVKAIAAGNWQEAMMALLKAVGRMLFALSAPVSVPLLMGSTPGMTIQQAFAKLRQKADRVTNKNPLFPVTLVIAIVQLSAGPSTATISGIVLSISPMIAVFVADPLLTNSTVKQLSGITSLDAMETAIENIIKMVVIVVQGLMKLPEILPKLKGQLQAAVERKMAKGAAGALELVTNTVRAFEAGFKSLNDAITKFQFQAVTGAAVQLLNTVPLMLAAFVGPEEMKAGAVPSITDWMSANEGAGRTVDQQQAALKAASIEFLNKLPFPQAMLVVVDRSMSSDLADRARLVAQVVGKTRKENRANFDSVFLPAFKAELLKV